MIYCDFTALSAQAGFIVPTKTNYISVNRLKSLKKLKILHIVENSIIYVTAESKQNIKTRWTK